MSIINDIGNGFNSFLTSTNKVFDKAVPFLQNIGEAGEAIGAIEPGSTARAIARAQNDAQQVENDITAAIVKEKIKSNIPLLVGLGIVGFILFKVR